MLITYGQEGHKMSQTMVRANSQSKKKVFAKMNPNQTVLFQGMNSMKTMMVRSSIQIVDRIKSRVKAFSKCLFLIHVKNRSLPIRNRDQFHLRFQIRAQS